MEPRRKATSGKARNSPCVVGCGTKAGTILQKSPGPFPCPFLTVIFLIRVDPFPVSWTRPPGHSCNLLPFIGQMMISGRQLENHAVEVFPTQMVREENKGL